MKNYTAHAIIQKTIRPLTIAAAIAGSLAAAPVFAGSTSSSGVPNPASVHCIESAGELVLVEDEAGNQSGYCEFGRASIEEWTLFRATGLGESVQAVVAYKKMGRGDLSGATRNPQPPVGLPNPAAVACINQSGDYGSLKVPSTNSEIATCSFSDGSSIDAWTLLAGPLDPSNHGLSVALGLLPR
jgi:putative hemolysin